jgi:acetyltransferase-like isoleucine patch superfamily enzyme
MFKNAFSLNYWQTIFRMIKYRYFFTWGKFGKNVYIGKDVKFLGDTQNIFFDDFAEIRDHSIIIFPNVKKIELKKNSSIGYFNVLNIRGHFILGENSMTGPFVSIVDSNHGIFEKEKIRFSNVIQEDIIIQNDVWIGTGAIVLMGVLIGEGSVVGANAVVNKTVEAFTVVAGIPAELKYYRSK